MKKIVFEDAQLFFQKFYIGKISSDIEFHGCFDKAVIDCFPSRHYAQVNSSDMILRFSLKEKSEGFSELTRDLSIENVNIKNLFSESGTVEIISVDGHAVKISEAFWARYPLPEFHLKHNPENTIHSLYFLW